MRLNHAPFIILALLGPAVLPFVFYDLLIRFWGKPDFMTRLFFIAIAIATGAAFSLMLLNIGYYVRRVFYRRQKFIEHVRRSDSWK